MPVEPTNNIPAVPIVKKEEKRESQRKKSTQPKKSKKESGRIDIRV